MNKYEKDLRKSNEGKSLKEIASNRKYANLIPYKEREHARKRHTEEGSSIDVGTSTD